MISVDLLVNGPLDQLLISLKDLLLRIGKGVDHHLQLLDDGILLLQILFAQTAQLFFHVVHVFASALWVSREKTGD